MSEQFCHVGRGITLCYETFGDPADPTALLVMGLGTQMVAWHADFCNDLAARGLYVVRFDNRDVGRSTHLAAPPPRTLQILLRSARAASYDLGDMAQDACTLLDELELGPAHVIGASMGGMIAQTLAARHPRSVRSLTSIMSNTGSRRSGQPSLALYPLFLRRAPRERSAFIEHTVRVFEAIGSPGLPREQREIRELVELSYDRGSDPAGVGRQLAAVLASGDRTSELHGIDVRTLVIHGCDDPLVAPSGGRATARAIPGSRLVLVPGMGHDMPRSIWPRLVAAIADHTRRADERATERLPLQTQPAPVTGLQG